MAKRSDLDEKALPSAVDVERLVLGAVLANDSLMNDVAAALAPEDFALTKHQKIFLKLREMLESGARIDHVTLATDLQRTGELESVDGLTYLVSLTDGMPRVAQVADYIRIVKEKSRLRKLVYAGQALMNQALQASDSADEIGKSAQAKLSEIGSNFGTSEPELIERYIGSYPGGINTLLDTAKREKPISTGFASVDAVAGGFRRSEIWLVCARPSHGKSALALALSKNVAARGHTVANFTMEMSKQECVDRMICERAGVSLSRFRRGEIDSHLRHRLLSAAQFIAELPVIFDESTGLKVSDIRLKVQKISNERAVSLIVVDYVQLMRARGRSGNENERFSEIAQDLQELNKTTGIPLVLLSQLNRDSERRGGDGRPHISQARGSGSWEQIANVGCCLYYEFMHKCEQVDLKELNHLLIQKNRSGPVGDVTLAWTPWFMRFADMPRDDSPKTEIEDD